MEMEIERTFPGAGKGLHEFYRREERRFRKVFPCLNTSYSGYGSLLSPPLIGALPYLRLGKSVYDNVGGYFEDDLCKMAFTFQAKYLGMSPWKCPAFFTIIPYIEHTFGVYHVKGGLAKISEAMAKVVAEEGGKIVLNTAVDRVLVKDGIATGVLLGTGEKIGADAVVVNADFAYAMSRLFDEGVLKKYTPQKLASMKYSCSTFMLYLGLDTRYDEPHHNILMSNNYRRDIEDMLTGHVHSDNMSIYIRNAAATDPTLAPEGKSGLYILVPVSNTSSGIAWDDDLVEEYIAKVLGHIRQRTSMKDIERHIVSKRVRTPDNWRNDFLLYNGATFSLAHNLSQMLVFRPHNRFEEVRRCYLVGGGTHPGSGLPTIYQSGVISSALLEKDLTCS
jgi:phytoene desaturase